MNSYFNGRELVGEAMPMKWEAPALTNSVIEALHASGFRSAVIFGGFLRDSFLGIKPNDIDIIAKHPRLGSKTTAQRLEKENIKGFEHKITHYPGGFKTLHCTAIFNNCALDIQTTRDITPPEQRVRYGDAPINRIAVGADGQVYADPKFEDHAKKGIYEILRSDQREVEASVKRYKKLKKRIPNLTLQLPEDYVAT